MIGVKIVKDCRIPLKCLLQVAVNLLCRETLYVIGLWLAYKDFFFFKQGLTFSWGGKYCFTKLEHKKLIKLDDVIVLYTV